MSQDRTELGQLGEFGLIDKLTNGFNLNQHSSILGIGDDAALIDRNEKELTVISTDMLVEGVHFNLMYVPLKHLGYKSVVVNISDIAAMNARPEQIVLSIAVSNRFSVEALEEFYSGVKAACEHYNVDLVGGDTTSSQSGLIVSITAIGVVEKSKVAKRSGAKENDLLVVTGDLGGAYVGLQVLERERMIYEENPSIQPDLEGHDYIIQRQLKPEARVDVLNYLSELGVVPTSMIDISDGLASEVLHICKQSKVGCHIYDEKIPIDGATSMTAIDFNLDPNTCALNGGEDYELLFTIKQSDYEKIKGNPHMTVIGHMTHEGEGVYYVDKNGSAIELQAQGWNHFDL